MLQYLAYLDCLLTSSISCQCHANSCLQVFSEVDHYPDGTLPCKLADCPFRYLGFAGTPSALSQLFELSLGCQSHIVFFGRRLNLVWLQSYHFLLCLKFHWVSVVPNNYYSESVRQMIYWLQEIYLLRGLTCFQRSSAIVQFCSPLRYVVVHCDSCFLHCSCWFEFKQ